MMIKIIFIVLNLSFANCLQCMICDNIVLPFNHAGELPSRCEGKMVEAVVCQAEFRIDYITNEIRLDLMNGDSVNRSFEINLSVQNKFVEPKKITSDMIYKCKDSNDCAKLFYQTTVQMLIDKESVLNQLRNELYDPTIVNVQQCIDSHDHSVTCENAYGCHGYEIITNGKPTFVGQCRNASSPTTHQYLFYEITLFQGNPSSESDWNHLGYTCNKGDLCNTKEKIKQMVKIADNYYPWEFIGVNSSININISNYYFLLILFYLLNYYIIPFE